MGIDAVFDSNNWAGIPFHFWSVVFFVFGSMVGSFLNVCIHRLPLGQSVVSPPSHCPHCQYSIPWYLNIPLFTWLYLRGRCRNCRELISIRYFIVELLTGLTFLACWLSFGPQSALLALVYAIFIAGLIAATLIDFEHFIIPDEITIGGIVVGFLCSLIVPALHSTNSVLASLGQSLLGIAVGWGLIYAILRLGKLFFGRQRLELPAQARVVFGETALHLPDRDVPYEDLFYRDSDTITLKALSVELLDRCYRDVVVQLSKPTLVIGEDRFSPEQVPHMEVVTSEVVLPREAMGFGDVKFMSAIGAFLGWKAVLFSLMVSSIIGSVVGITLIVLQKREWSSRLPYGPYIALAAVIWIFGGREFVEWFFAPR